MKIVLLGALCSLHFCVYSPQFHGLFLFREEFPIDISICWDKCIKCLNQKCTSVMWNFLFIYQYFVINLPSRILQDKLQENVVPVFSWREGMWVTVVLEFWLQWCKASEQLLRKKIIKDIEVKLKWHKIQHGFNKSRLYQINLIHFFDKK